MSLFYCMQGRVPAPTAFVVCCKGCKEQVAAGVDAAPKDNIVVACPLCGERRRYRVAEVYKGWPEQPARKQVERAEAARLWRARRA